jgi:hypothetical protein
MKKNTKMDALVGSILGIACSSLITFYIIYLINNVPFPQDELGPAVTWTWIAVLIAIL